MNPHDILKKTFGYDTFREGQLGLVNTLLEGRDALGVMPTGAGKSLCYQVPALMLPGVTIVISPLISLMRDQVQALAANGVAAAFINSSLTAAQLDRVMYNAGTGQYKIIYVAPERLLASGMLELCGTIDISLVAVDEAHCISQWGQDFRPSYLDIPVFVDKLPRRPVLAAFTATATPRVRQDILSALALERPLVTVTGFDRPNLYFEVRHPKDKYAALAAYLEEHEGSGIVYCSTRKEVEAVAQRLKAEGFSAARYHAGLPDGERTRSQDDFLHDRADIIVATNAFGMGIDKSNVRFVIHYNMPQNVESYYQEAGRAGRDGLPADCILFFARKDINTALFLIEKSENQEEVHRNRTLLNKMERYCHTDICLRRYLLEYFGDPGAGDCGNCGNCGNCNGSFVETDITVDAQKILSHITRLNNLGRRFMFTFTMDILQGKSDNFTDLPTFGLMKGTSRPYLRRIVDRLVTLGYVDNQEGLSVTPRAREVLVGGAPVCIRGEKPSAPARKKREEKQARAQYTVSDTLLARLKALRLEIAREGEVPAFVVFSDATLVDMCGKHPRTEEEMLEVSGVGQVKLERYGQRFLQLLRETQPEAEGQAMPDELTEEALLELLDIEEEPAPITRIADSLSAVFLRCGMPKISGARLNKLLLEAGCLEETDGIKLPTDYGRQLGITAVERQSERGTRYTQCLFGPEVQRLCARLALRDGEA